MNDNLVTRSTAVADEQGMAEVAIAGVWFAGCQAHWLETVRTNRRADGCGGTRLTNLWHHAELPKDLVVAIIRQEKPGSKPQFRIWNSKVRAVAVRPGCLKQSLRRMRGHGRRPLGIAEPGWVRGAPGSYVKRSDERSVPPNPS